jgi:cyclic-di-GMP phosphodiesterase TipF (flagellum assembly factor)
MPITRNTAILSFAAVGGLAVAAFLHRLGGWPIGTALLMGGFCVLGVVQALLTAALRRERARTEEALNAVAAAQDRLRTDMETTRRLMLNLSEDVDAKVSSRNDRVVSEVKVLEVLIRRLAEGIAAKSRAFPAGEDAGSIRPDAKPLTAADLGRGGPDDAAMLEIVRRSLEDNRVDLYLQPVVSLPQRKVRFYEAFSRLRSEDGAVIMPSQYIRVAEPAGLMSVVDNVLLFRCVQVVRRLTIRNKDMAVFCNISRYTLQDTGFFAQFLDFMQHNRDLSGLIIFELSQDTLDACGPIEDSNLSYLADLGFGFSLDKVTSLDLDFARLRERRLRYIKIPAATLLGDISKAGAPVAAPDLKELLARNGLNLIAEKIEHEREVVNLLDFNVDFAQGFLFGEPRPLRDTMLGGAPAAPPRKAAPAAEWPKPFPDPLAPGAPEPVRPSTGPVVAAEALRPTEEPWPRRKIAAAPIATLAVSTLPPPREFPKARRS